jgi:TatD DNase family protein
VIQLFDTHAHLQDPAFDDMPAVLDRAAAAGASGIALCGYDPEANERTLRLASTSKLLYPAVGYHPHEAKDITPALLSELESQAELPEVVAIGEIGLDFFRDHSPHEDQRRVLDSQLAIALRVAKPVCIHSRGAEEEVFEQLSAYATSAGWSQGDPPVGVMHCFGGTLDQAQRYVALGFLVSLACVITYPSNDEARKIAAGLPLESLVVETDSPYLPPQGLRGKRNEPANVVRALEALAQARGISVEHAAEATTRNAQRLFRIAVPAGAART